MTGCKGLFVNASFTIQINGVPKDEGDEILAFLYKHFTQPAFHVRFQWKPNSIAF